MKINKELLKGSTTILILSLLNKKDMYGYEMIKEIEIRSKNVFSFKEGTLYPTQGARKRKYYKITNSGKKLLSEKEREWKLFSSTVNNLLWEDGLCLQ